MQAGICKYYCQVMPFKYMHTPVMLLLLACVLYCRYITTMAVRKYASMLSQLKPVCNLRKVQFLCNIDVVKSYSVWERDRYGDYVKEESESVTQAAKDGVKVFGKELRKFAKERRKVGLPLHNFQHGVEHNDYQVVYKFDNEEVINEWKVVADKAFSQGKSEAEFVLGPQKHGIFRGVVNTDVVKDGVLKYAGYAGIRSPLYMVVNLG